MTRTEQDEGRQRQKKTGNFRNRFKRQLLKNTALWRDISSSVIWRCSWKHSMKDILLLLSYCRWNIVRCLSVRNGDTQHILVFHAYEHIWNKDPIELTFKASQIHTHIHMHAKTTASTDNITLCLMLSHSVLCFDIKVQQPNWKLYHIFILNTSLSSYSE